MQTFNKWFETKSIKFSENTFLIDTVKKITYAENFQQVQVIKHQLQGIPPGSPVLYIGTTSIEACQLYFAIISLHAVWIPVLQPDNVKAVLEEIKPALIIYDRTTFVSHTYNRAALFNEFPSYELEDIFYHQKPIDYFSKPTDLSAYNLAISGYLTSGSTGKPKIVLHGWHGTWHHAEATVKRYQLDSSKRLFNPRELAHVSGAFAYTTYMHCGGSIVIPSRESRNKPESEKIACWAETLFEIPEVTHISFFPSEMEDYADFIEKNPHVRPLHLERITTGGEEVEFSRLVKVSGAFAANRFIHDLIWKLFPLTGNTWFFDIIKSLYENYYRKMVQATSTWGATEVICNGIAHTPLSGPDFRQSGFALDCLHPEIIDSTGAILPKDGKAIGRLRFFGESIALGYINQPETEKDLLPCCYTTSDLAIMYPDGTISLQGRAENLFMLEGSPEKINPLILEREIHHITGQKALVFACQNKVHAAICLQDGISQQQITRHIRKSTSLFSISTFSFWDAFPLLPSRKIDRKSVESEVINERKPVFSAETAIEDAGYRYCPIF